MNKVTIALVLGAVFAMGCGDKTDAAGSGSAKASGAASVKTSAAPAASSAAPAASSAAAPDAAGDTIGVQECDDYVKKWKECYKDPTTKAAMEPGLKTMTDEWKKQAAAGGAQKDGLKMVCKASLDAFKSDACK